MSAYWSTPDPWVILALGFLMIFGPVAIVIFEAVEDRRSRRCAFRTNGGMHCAGKRRHDGPHTFTNREWRRTRNAAATPSTKGTD